MTKHFLNDIIDLILDAYRHISGEKPKIAPALRELDKANKLLHILIEDE